jgi:hypothetical protein
MIMPNTFKVGVGVGLLLHLLQIPICFLLLKDSRTITANLAAVLLFIGFTQWVYMIPALIALFVAGKIRMVQGVLLVAGLTFLINLAICAGVIPHR